VLGTGLKGPCSLKNPIKLLQPGPPFNLLDIIIFTDFNIIVTIKLKDLLQGWIVIQQT
jgi:hypothetical protein